MLEVDFDAARSFGGDERATGITGATPVPGHAAVGKDLARKLELRRGDKIDVFAYGSSVRLTVDDVLPQRGVAGLWLSMESLSPNVFVAPGTIAGLMSESPGAAPSAAPPVSMMLISNSGGVIGGASASDEVEAALKDRLGDLPANIVTVKADLLKNADESGAQLMQLFTMLGGFAVLAGVLLLVNIFVMLADERRSELGMLRAVGMRRSSLIGAFATEGWCYAIASSVAGTFVGLGLGRVIMGFAARIFDSGDEEFRLPLRFSFEWESVGRGMAIGFAIAIITVVLTSLQISRVNIIRAIRDITEPVRRGPRRRSQVFGWILTVGGGAAALGGFASAQATGVLLGPPMLFTGAAIVLGRKLPRGPLITTTTILILVWGSLRSRRRWRSGPTWGS
ncbi:MAG: ABC transporter permease [Acidimicrobiia bacterium]|nr:ABC transporter permease [Acidimicrobiia bacterium]